MAKNLSVQNRLTIIDQVSIAKYLGEINVDKDTVPLTPDMEHNMFLEYKIATDMVIKQSIKDRIIKANLRWVVTIAKQFDYPKSRLEDLINEGNIGLIKAIDKFDTTRGTKFLTFATWYIRQEITMYATDVLADVVQPANRYKINRLVARAEKMLRANDNEFPSSEQIIEVYMRIKESTDPVISVADYIEIKTQSKGFVSMETQLADKDGEDMTLSGTFKSGSEYNPDHEIAKSDKKYEINKMLSSVLNDREKEIVEYTFGLNGREEKTLDQVAIIIGLTRERAGQLLQGSINKLQASKKKKVMELCGSSKESAHSIESNHWAHAVKG